LLQLLLDVDLDETTGVAHAGLGYDLSFDFRQAQGRGHDREPDPFFHSHVRFRAAPTIDSAAFEIAIARRFVGDGALAPFIEDVLGDPLFPLDQVRLSLGITHPDVAGDETDPVTHTLDQRPTRPVEPIPITRARPGDLRILSYNVLFDSPWAPEQEPRFGRQLRAAAPDVVCFQEIYERSIDESIALVARWVDPPPGAEWTGVRHEDNHLVTWMPILDSWPVGGNLFALVDTTEFVGAPSLIFNAHYRCCSADEERQEEADATIAFIRNARAPGEGALDLPPDAPVFITGDLNLVGRARQLETLLTGDILDEETFGSDAAPDADGTSLADLFPRQTHADMTYTWRNDFSGFWPGKLDYIIYSDALLSVSRAFSIFTPNMPPETLAAHALEEDDSLASDHLPIVADFRPGLP